MSSQRILWAVSAENTPYMAWQCAVLWESAGRPSNMVLVLHRQSRMTDPMFEACGAPLLMAPSYRLSKRDYAPRNTIGTLLESIPVARAGGYTHIGVIDPDMVCVGNGLSMFEEGVARVGYGPASEKAFLELFGGEGRELWTPTGASERLRVGSPYIVPVEMAYRLGTAWLQVLDGRCTDVWESSMWSMPVAALRVGWNYPLLKGVWPNHMPDIPPPIGTGLIHYGYGDGAWTKRGFGGESTVVFRDSARPRTLVEGSVRHLILEAIWRTGRKLGLIGT